MLQLLGDFVPQTPYRGFAPRPHWGTPASSHRRLRNLPVAKTRQVGTRRSEPPTIHWKNCYGTVQSTKEAHSVPLKRKLLQDDCDLYYAPKAGDVLADDELETCCQLMNDIVRSEHVSRVDWVRLIELLKQTYPNGRMLINDRATCLEVRRKYPGLFTVTGLLTDYAEMTRQRIFT